MDMVCINGRIKAFIKETGKITRGMERATTNGVMAKRIIQANGTKTTCMVKVF